MDGITLNDRLEAYAKEGHVSCTLNLYKRQIEKLALRDGLAVQRGAPVSGYKGQFRCKIGWRYAMSGTTAYHLLQLSIKNNPELKKEIESSGDSDNDPMSHPYDSGWNL